MPLDILLPLILLPLLILVGLMWYRKAINRLEPDAAPREISGWRLTSEHLRRLPSPPWRVVYEIPADRLGDIDHVAIGPAGVIAITTVMADRPNGEVSSDPTLVAATAVGRGAVDELTERAGLRCNLLAKVFWGSPQPDQPAAREITYGSVGVVGQRLDDWLANLPDDGLSAGQIDLAWTAVLTGIGRPDPLA